MFRGYEVAGRVHSASRATATSTSKRKRAARVLESVAEELHNRRKGDAVRMEIDAARLRRDRRAAAA